MKNIKRIIKWALNLFFVQEIVPQSLYKSKTKRVLKIKNK